MDITLVGGGWDLTAQHLCLSPFLSAATAHGRGAEPRIGLVWMDEGDGQRYVDRWIDLLQGIASVKAEGIAVPIGSSLPDTALDGIDGLFVCGGLTPAYADAFAATAATIRSLVVDQGLPYAGSSAGAAVAAATAVVGGWLDGDRVLCPDDAAEDLEQVTVTQGLGLVDAMVDVHTSAWGTLPRLAAGLRAAGVAQGLGLDENTAWHVRPDGSAEVLGRNAVHVLTGAPDGTLRWEVRGPSTGR